MLATIISQPVGMLDKYSLRFLVGKLARRPRDLGLLLLAIRHNVSPSVSHWMEENSSSVPVRPAATFSKMVPLMSCGF